jgi:hypothetical protein
MAVQGDEGLPSLNEPSNCNAADVKVEWCMVDKPAIQWRAIKAGVIRRRVEQKNGVVKVVAVGQSKQILLDGSPPGFVLFDEDAAYPFLR